MSSLLTAHHVACLTFYEAATILWPRHNRRVRKRQSGHYSMAVRGSFYMACGLCVSSGLLCMVLVVLWNWRWRGGFAWDGTEAQFNWHPVLMTGGMLVLYGLAAVLFRVPWGWSQDKKAWKLVHAGLMLAALLLAVVGLHAAFHVHSTLNIPSMYSLHSWVGMCAVLTFAWQWFLGLVSFLMPCSAPVLGHAMLGFHVWTGQTVLMLTLAACISGINEQLFFALDGVQASAYSSLPAEALFGNTLGILILVFSTVVFGILSKANWRRPAANTNEEATPILLREEAS
ncbi:lysosomal membrane ascorbate-dependent ferrireductase CYB561A3-like [Corythoichthys intestinalis]|uniref:lysosomal membrane ascorbate-dependent ferrireductase CYB561A3-like n=1 Tax=Corythoichthys intestinalis TaxID=161448 RepID=UPI0025A55908|nr:lysosomal membrane ascorbate-dependent ferrireductase CYB561A3-like [Corythoichthys intestinalis]XP_061800559.1 lysosomal membrane ascorbate-dependent ferrireductase CYB561A3-like [Nerophis lumbriciformis]